MEKGNYQVVALLESRIFKVLHRCNSVEEARRVWADSLGKGYIDVWWSCRSVKSKAMKEITSFLALPMGNKWIESDDRISMYLRRTRHHIDNETVECIDIANIAVSEEYQGQGIFTGYLLAIEALAQVHNLTVYIENIHNPRLGAFLLKRGYIKIPNITDFCVYQKF